MNKRHLWHGCGILAWWMVAGFVGPLRAQQLSGDGAFSEIPEAEISDDERSHWSYRPLERPPLPQLADAEWCRTPIDAFILAQLQRKSLAPRPEAKRAILLRRLSFDLRGLPPSPEEIRAFEADERVDAYERWVDLWLESPAYGERWAQHWLDLARFAETDGFEHDKVRPNAWRYRDWVIEALNQDLPYDQFILQQLAGDELSTADAAGNLPTAFCLSGPDMPDLNSQDERRHVLLNELTSTVGSVFLGLQFGCAQCHDHKYDPISAGDFYRLRACFEPSISVQRDKLVFALRVNADRPSASHLYVRGDWRNPGPAVLPDFPRIANPWQDTFSPAAQESNHGRRLELARWMTRPDHPLVTRVMANRLWQFHFGVGLSETPSDFGILGDEPLHAELLDWLASELVGRGWSLKRMHRLIVTSAVYRQAGRAAELSADSTETVSAETARRYYCHFPRRRLSGEELRDAMLFGSGTLETTAGGPGVMPPLPDELSQTLLRGQWTVSARTGDHYRRSIYVFARRNLRFPIFEVFDRPDANASCPDRNRSTTAPQSLYLLNSRLVLDAARRLAGSVLAETDQQPEQIQNACLRTLGRLPTESEQQRFAEFLRLQEQFVLGQPQPVEGWASPIPGLVSANPAYGVAFTDLCLALFNLSEFLYVE